MVRLAPGNEENRERMALPAEMTERREGMGDNRFPFEQRTKSGSPGMGRRGEELDSHRGSQARRAGSRILTTSLSSLGSSVVVWSIRVDDRMYPLSVPFLSEIIEVL